MSVIVALANFVGSVWLVAVTVALCEVEMVEGAVYNPALEI
jgi:hypothetical protein